MKASTVLALAAAAAVRAHYTFPGITGTKNWQYVRETTNHDSTSPVTDVTSEQIRCYQLAGGAEGAQVYPIKAGGTITFDVNPNIFHPGALSGWMAKAPEGTTADQFDGTGAVWFKMYQEVPTISSSGMTWASENLSKVNFKIPTCIADGDYLFRIEHVALHNAATMNGAQFYISCAQIRVSGGSGSKTPTNLVSFPGAYKASDPGLLVNIWTAKSYTPAGPAAFTC